MRTVDDRREDLSEDDSDLRSDSDDITIYIDRSAFRIPWRAVTGHQLRKLALPAIGADYELFHVFAGSEDLLVRDEEVVELEDGARFFSAPRMIMAGAPEAASHAGSHQSS
jgi:hypothetical protein